MWKSEHLKLLRMADIEKHTQVKKCVFCFYFCSKTRKESKEKNTFWWFFFLPDLKLLRMAWNIQKCKVGKIFPCVGWGNQSWHDHLQGMQQYMGWGDRQASQRFDKHFALALKQIKMTSVDTATTLIWFRKKWFAKMSPKKQTNDWGYHSWNLVLLHGSRCLARCLIQYFQQMRWSSLWWFLGRWELQSLRMYRNIALCWLPARTLWGCIQQLGLHKHMLEKKRQSPVCAEHQRIKNLNALEMISLLSLKLLAWMTAFWILRKLLWGDSTAELCIRGNQSRSLNHIGEK